MENYIVINGKKAELTEEQLRALGIPTNSSPFGARTQDTSTFYISDRGGIGLVSVNGSYYDKMDKVANVFNDSEYANQVALHQELYRKLLKFREEYQIENCCLPLFYITYDYFSSDFKVLCSRQPKHFGEVYFNNAEIAQKAIQEVVRPFIEKHSNFKKVM